MRSRWVVSLLLLLASVGNAESGHLPVPVSGSAVDLIVRYEVGSEKLYTARYQRPLVPCSSNQVDTCYSGVTIGIGSDLGHQSQQVILSVWKDHRYLSDLVAASGVRGGAALVLVRRMQHIETPWPLAYDVFINTDLVRYWRIANGAFGDNFIRLSREAQGALTSVVYNRGGSMAGPSRREMREIRDVCIPAMNEACIATQLLEMRRLWKTKGLVERRAREALLITTRGAQYGTL